MFNFYHSPSMPCPYIKGLFEQQTFIKLSNDKATEEYNELSRAGFRRSHDTVYRPSCCKCNACKTVRIKVNDFKLNKNWQRILNKNKNISMKIINGKITDGEYIGQLDNDEQFNLFSKYVTTRHMEGGMAAMSRDDYNNLLSSPVDTNIIEFRDMQNKLVSGCIIDNLDDGISAVYSFFDINLVKNSLGSYMILKLIELANKHNLPYVYLGFIIKNNPKMIYKSRFKPLELFKNGLWQPYI